MTFYKEDDMKKKIGVILVIIGFFILLGIAGTDDVAMMQGIHAPVLSLMIKALIPLGMLGAGAVMLNGGAE